MSESSAECWQIPWLSVQDQAFPPRAPRQRRRILRSKLGTSPVVYPAPEPVAASPTETEEVREEVEPGEIPSTEPTTSEVSTPLPSDTPSDAVSTQPSSIASAAGATSAKSQQTPTQPKARLAGPVLPAVPLLPPSPTAARRSHRDSIASTQTKLSDPAPSSAEKEEVTAVVESSDDKQATAEGTSPVASAPPAPKSWANLFRSNNTQAGSFASAISQPSAVGSGIGRSEALSDVLNDMNSGIEPPIKISFLKPRGLVNTGNMCYMNSVSLLTILNVSHN